MTRSATTFRSSFIVTIDAGADFRIVKLTVYQAVPYFELLLPSTTIHELTRKIFRAHFVLCCKSGFLPSAKRTE